MNKALIIGATGSLRDTVEAVARAGWDVTATGRSAAHVPSEWAGLGVRFEAVDRHDPALEQFVDGVDLLVDAMTYRPDDARQLAGWSRRVGGTVQISSNAVYRDQSGLVDETRGITPFAGEEIDSQHGYSANKAECDRVLAAHGERVSLLRPGKIHGPGCRRPREWAVVKRVLDGRPAILLPGDGMTRESTTSTLNLADAVLACAAAPSARVVNVADGEPIPVRDMVRVIIDAVEPGRDVALAESPAQSEWRLPWFADKRLSTARFADLLGRTPRTYTETVGREVGWVLGLVQGSAGDRALPGWLDNEFFEGAFPYELEDAFLAGLNRNVRAVT